jgi:glucose-6-phosphate 1-dehydrogenase
MIFGATGDLTYLKLIPALFSLYKEGELCPSFKLVCIGRRNLTIEEYLKPVDGALTKELSFHTFKEHIIYHQMDFTKSDVYAALKKLVDSSNWIFYLATAPRFFDIIASELHANNFLDEKNGFRRIVFEKPFGVNFNDAKRINKHISKLLDEDQIFRIDHYLGKEMVQNILLTRAHNNFFEMLWHKDAIDYFEVVISEDTGVKNRGSYYDSSGALKDMVQNHMFQIVALLAMDLPEILIPEAIEVEKTKVLKHLHLTHNIILGQYKGYLNEKGISENSNTETFAALEIHVDNRRWKGVPFYLKTGKALESKYAHVVVHFKSHGQADENILIIQVQPDEGIKLRVNSKKPGISNEIDTVTMDYCHSCLKFGDEPSAYGRLLLDIVAGDKSLFASWEEIELSWQVIDKIEKLRLSPQIYTSGDNWGRQVVLKKGWWQDD